MSPAVLFLISLHSWVATEPQSPEPSAYFPVSDYFPLLCSAGKTPTKQEIAVDALVARGTDRSPQLALAQVPCAAYLCIVIRIAAA